MNIDNTTLVGKIVQLIENECGPEIIRDYRIADSKIKSRQSLEERIDVLEKALLEIYAWNLPDSGIFWEDESGQNTAPMSYEAAFGSNGAREYMRKLAAKVLGLEYKR